MSYKPLGWPVNMPVTNLFGTNPHTYGKWGLKGHNGIDFANGHAGDPVYFNLEDTMEDGSIVKSQARVAHVGPLPGVGNAVIIWCPLKDLSKHGVFIHYYHLQEIHVRYKQPIPSCHIDGNGNQSSGTVIGTVGNGGNSTGPHLHMMVTLCKENPKWYDSPDEFPPGYGYISDKGRYVWTKDPGDYAPAREMDWRSYTDNYNGGWKGGIDFMGLFKVKPDILPNAGDDTLDIMNGYTDGINRNQPMGNVPVAMPEKSVVSPPATVPADVNPPLRSQDAVDSTGSKDPVEDDKPKVVGWGEWRNGDPLVVNILRVAGAWLTKGYARGGVSLGVAAMLVQTFLPAHADVIMTAIRDIHAVATGQVVAPETPPVAEISPAIGDSATPAYDTPVIETTLPRGPAPVMQQTQQSPYGTATVLPPDNATVWNVRSGASTLDNVIDKLYPGVEVEIVAVGDGWYYIEYSTGSGWIHADALSPAEERSAG